MPGYVMPPTVPTPDTGVPSDMMLPGLRGLAKLADLRPVIVIDGREQAPLRFERLRSIPGTLYSGDYSIAGLESRFAVERKSIDDLANCCLAGQRDRFEHELLRLPGYRFRRLLVIGTREDIAAGRYHSRIAPKAVLATLGAFEARYLPVVFAETPEAGAREIERWSWWFAREVVEAANDLLRGSNAAAPSSTEPVPLGSTNR
jgi:DNA excision repair protein ERCC-4